MGAYFGTDGFRGEAGKVVTCEKAYRVGRYLGWYYGARTGGACRVVIGKDPRRSSYMLEYALASGVAASGGGAYILHVTTTPSVSFIARTEGFDCGVMISASHNPFYDNGIKIFNRFGEKADEALIKGVEEYLDGGDIPLAAGAEIGRTVDYVSGRNRYIGHLVSLAASSYKGLKIGLDCANGSAFSIAPSVFTALGARVCCIGTNPNGLNINDGCGSTGPEKLAALVREQGLDIGFAFDGDADRCICVDERGEVVDGDGELFICAGHLKNSGTLTQNKVVATIVSNGGLERALGRRGIECVRCDVGDRKVYEAMNLSGAAIGGEQSGHIIFGKLESTGDGLVTAINICEILCQSGGTLSALLRGYSPVPQICASVKVSCGASVLESIRFKEELACAEEHMRGSGRIVVRKSGTEPLIRVLVESEDKQLARNVCARLADIIERL